jgi:hypothetical protein
MRPRSTLVADRQEQVGAEVVPSVLRGAPPQTLELGGHFAGAGGAGGFGLGCAHRVGQGILRVVQDGSVRADGVELRRR